jgi:CRP-like cAMP-binding protein
MLLSEAPPRTAESPHIAPATSPHVTPDAIAAAAQRPCETCRFQKLNFCGALFGGGREQPQGRHKAIAARHNIYRAGEPNEGVQIVCSGWAVRFIQLPDGKRQILSVIMPGDLISPTALFEPQFAFSVQAVTGVRYCIFPFADVRARLRDNPALLDLWIRLAAAEHRETDRRLVDLGQRTAQERIAGLVAHVMLRAEQRGDLNDGQFAFPMSQQQIADFTGLTPVHTCRVLSALRRTGVCDVGHGAVRLLDRAELQRLAAFK